MDNLNQQDFLFKQLINATKNSDLKLVNELLAQGANPNAKIIYRTHPLHYAAINGNLEIATALLDAGENPNSRNYDGNISLYLAVRNGHTDLIPYLISRGADFFELNESLDTLLHSACRSKNLATVVKVLSIQNDLQNNNDVNVLNSSGETPLHLASEKGSTEIVNFLIQQGANLEAKAMGIDMFGKTPLHLACEQNHVEVLDLLIRRGAGRKAVNKEGNSPLHLTAYAKSTSVVTYLLERGENKYYLNNKGKTPLDLVIDMVFIDDDHSTFSTSSDVEAEDNIWKKETLFCFLAFMSEKEIEDAQNKYQINDFNDAIKDFKESILDNQRKLFKIFGLAYIQEIKATFLEGLEPKLIANQLSKCFPVWYAHMIEDDLKLVYSKCDKIREKWEIKEMFTTTPTPYCPSFSSQSEDQDIMMQKADEVIEVEAEAKKRKREEDNDGPKIKKAKIDS